MLTNLLATGAALGVGAWIFPAGRAAWYLPFWLERALPKVSFGHGETAGVPATPPVRSRRAGLGG